MWGVFLMVKSKVVERKIEGLNISSPNDSIIFEF